MTSIRRESSKKEDHPSNIELPPGDSSVIKIHRETLGRDTSFLTPLPAAIAKSQFLIAEEMKVFGEASAPAAMDTESRDRLFFCLN